MQNDVAPRSIKASSVLLFQIIRNKYSAAAQELPENCEPGSLDHSVDSTISEAANEEFAAWQRHDEAASDFCDLHGKSGRGLYSILIIGSNSQARAVL